MLRILINQTTVLPIEDDVYKTDPMSIFDKYYTSTNTHTSISFSEWILKFILPVNFEKLNADQMKKHIADTLASTSKMNAALLKLYPSAYIMSKENWPMISAELHDRIRAKYKRKPTLFDYDKQVHLFNTNKNTILSI